MSDTHAAPGLDYITDLLARSIEEVRLLEVRGRVTQITGTIIKAMVPGARIGELCHLRNPGEDFELVAEVVGFSGKEALLTPMGEIYGVSSNTEVIPTGRMQMVPVGPGLLGRVLDGLGEPLDQDRLGPLEVETHYPVYQDAPDPLKRRIIDKPLALGLRVLDGLLTCGEGQRLGIFAAAGGGKSTLLSMLVRGADVDVTVLALIGERGREVREFIEHDLGPEGSAKSVIVVATSDRPSMERAKAAYVATAIAEYFRDQGRRVLLLMDSVTRFARAQREIGLAAGEPPTRRGFPPSVFATLPRLMERVGQSDKGFITALYTVLVEGDDMTEPVADETRSILDGHIILSRKLAAANHYPAIDVLASVSRVMGAIVAPEHRAAASRVRELMAKYEEVELLVKIGEYKKGSDPLADEALSRIDAIRAFLRQRGDERPSFEETVATLRRLVG
ncbi:type III secretion system ATPase SctN [Halochromatium roseum]|uniref:type III secretion system ATPase SctN n=1 Tax=Halochromatium roseum TaxID=391920 RepID=UPI00142B4BEA|nr:type III secretion system ATPase SctN [Halochromatium roseum]MBK5941096.1 EscN/YscN/HrcN family type III secretion system ATPase [Halochromatium roseum]NEX16197.1 EscN/YscN/HrcN family type III secretion system ATPase [Halochromatium sp.]